MVQMNEFSLINSYFRSIPHHRDDVIAGIGDDAACLQIPDDMHLVVSCDTLLEGVHFLNAWDAYDIATRAVMVNVSDMAAMGAIPTWLLLALTLPSIDEEWLQHFSQGLKDSLNHYHIALVGGNTARGPLSITLSIHGLVPKGQGLRRSGAQVGDIIYVSGELGAAALAVAFLTQQNIDALDRAIVMKKLIHPEPRISLGQALLPFATAAIDISDGLAADLYHICEESDVGACLMLDQIPVHPLVKKYQGKQAIDFVLAGGDDYELCFTVAPKDEKQLLRSLSTVGLPCFPIGVIEKRHGVRAKTANGELVALSPKGYSHF